MNSKNDKTNYGGEKKKVAIVTFKCIRCEKRGVEKCSWDVPH